MSKKRLKEYTFLIEGMHCPSCEILIEKRLLKEKGVRAADASTAKKRVRIEYKGGRPSVAVLNKIFAKDNYTFFDPSSSNSLSGLRSGSADAPMSTSTVVPQTPLSAEDFVMSIIIAAVLILLFVSLSGSKVYSIMSVSAASGLSAFFVFGLLAGISTCAALVGGIILSMSKQWSEMHDVEAGSKGGRFVPHILFNGGRLVSYTILGGVLGAIGGSFQISTGLSSFLTFGVALFMFVLGLQMLGFKSLQRFQITLPKFATRYVADEANFKSKYMPFVMGGLTFFLPCGFTITAQALAVASGSVIGGSLIMFSFALGTLLPLLLIGFSSAEFVRKPSISGMFTRIAGFLVLFFAAYTFNAQLNVVGVASFSDLKVLAEGNGSSEKGLAPVISGKQVLKMKASSSGYSPSYFKVKAGVPVRWEITDTGTSGCTNAVISKGLFSGEIRLTPGKTSIKEFTPKKPGKYKFSCWMGMVTGTIEVVDGSES
jgi:uncharacterized protein